MREPKRIIFPLETKLAYLEHNLVNANDVFQGGYRFFEAFADAMHVRHEFQIIVL
jgi:hypothetical protein